jgi:hypothetical protein
MLARKAIKIYLPLDNYHRAWRERGFADSDFMDGGSDAFIDALIPWGDLATIKAAYARQIEQGVGHIIMTPLGLDLDHDSGWQTISDLTQSLQAGGAA